VRRPHFQNAPSRDYDRELIADMLNQYAASLTSGDLDGAGHFSPASIHEQAVLLLAAEDADAAGVHTAHGSPNTQEEPTVSKSVLKRIAALSKTQEAGNG
jgi:hypothetical protein